MRKPTGPRPANRPPDTGLPAYDALSILLPIAYVIGVAAFMVARRIWIPQQFVSAAAIVLVILIGRRKRIFLDWMPFLFLPLGYGYLHGIDRILTEMPDITTLPTVDRAVFGAVTPIAVQHVFHPAAGFRWYDYAATGLYLSHYVVPLAVGFWLWRINRPLFRQYGSAFLILSCMAFVTYMLFPAMPPWMAAKAGYLPPIAKIMDAVLASSPHPVDVPSVYRFVGANLVAPFPSVHSAYPTLLFLFLRRLHPLWGIAAFLYAASIWFTVVYLGEHYAVDAVGGILYAAAAVIIVNRMPEKLNTAAARFFRPQA
jgi:hypothetical protein